MRLTSVVPLLVLLPLATYAASRDLAPAVRAEMVSEHRVALVIGNGAYASSPLKNPPGDARAMASALRDLGFEVIHKQDLSQKEMKKAIRDFGDQLAAGGVGLFYYAGHGMQVNGKNYLIPVDAHIQGEADVDIEGVDAGAVLAKMDNASNRLNLVILDACRNNPFERSFRSSSRGLAFVNAPSGTLVAYATAPGSVAVDADSYTRTLLRHIKSPGLAIEDMFKAVRTDLDSQTRGQQVPWESSSLKGDFYFVLPPNGGAPPDRPEKASEADIRLAELRAEAPTAWSKLANLRRLGGPDAKRYVEDFVARYQGSGASELDAARVWLDAYIEVVEPMPSAPAPSAGGNLSGRVIDAHGYKMISLPGGTFTMGCTSGQSDCDSDEKPTHRVTISGFALGATEVTQGLWNSVMGSNPSRFSSCGDACPVEKVSWLDSVAFANKLSSKEGLEECYHISGETVTWPKGLACRGYRLPTEAEWEYAARAGGDTLYAGSDNVGSVAWYGAYSDGNSSKSTNRVGGKSPNRWGLYDMSGNVYEWVWDRYQSSYQSSSSVDPVGPQSGSNRVFRGGGWGGTPRYVRVAVRFSFAPSDRDFSVGLRLSRSIP